MPLLKPVRGIQLNKSHPLARGLTACWLFNEGTGGEVCDLGRFNVTGYFEGSGSAVPDWVAGPGGYCLEFNGGSHECIRCGTGKLGWDQTNEISVVTSFMNTSGAQYGRDLFHRSAYSNPVRLYLMGWNMTWDVDTDGTSTEVSFSTSANTWYHVAGTWTSGRGRIYKDGVLADSDAGSGNLGFYNDNQEVNIGGFYNAGSPSNGVTGRIPYVYVWNRELSAAEVARLYREPFAMFEELVGPASIYATAAVVSLAGSASAQSVTSATLGLLSKISGTVIGSSDVTALLKSISNLLETERTWLRDALFNGMTANAYKLGTTLSLGWFWTRVTGCSALYRELSMEQIDFVNLLTVAEQNACTISPPSYLPHNSNSTYFYVVRRFNNCGYQEHTLNAAVKVSIDAGDELEKPQPNNLFSSKAEQVEGNKMQLVWFYCRTGQIDYENPIATISYQGRKFYRYLSDALEADKYLFAIRAEDADGEENDSSARLSIQLDAENPQPISMLSAEAV